MMKSSKNKGKCLNLFNNIHFQDLSTMLVVKNLSEKSFQILSTYYKWIDVLRDPTQVDLLFYTQLIEYPDIVVHKHHNRQNQNQQCWLYHTACMAALVWPNCLEGRKSIEYFQLVCNLQYNLKTMYINKLWAYSFHSLTVKT